MISFDAKHISSDSDLVLPGKDCGSCPQSVFLLSRT